MRTAIPLAEIVEMFAPTLGREKSEDLVRRAAADLRLGAGALERADVLALVDRLGEEQGVAGLAARFVRSRYLRLHGRASSPPRAPATNAPAADTDDDPSASSRTIVASAALTQLLAPTLGEERSAELFADVARKLGLRADRLSRTDALRVLDELAVTPGIVGVAARFAKARALLLFG